MEYNQKNTPSKSEKKIDLMEKYGLATILLVAIPFTGGLGLDRIIFAQNKNNAIVRLILGIFIGFILWIVDLVKLVLGQYDRETLI